MAIGSILLYLLAQTIELVQEGALRSRTLSKRTLQEYQATHILASTIENLLPPTPDDLIHPIIATGNHLEFSTSPAASRARWGIVRARLSINNASSGGASVTLDFLPSSLASHTTDTLSRYLLLSELVAAELLYLYRNPKGLENFPALPDQLPELITLTWITNEAPQIKKEFAIRPRLTLSGRCQLDAVTGFCR